MDGSSQSTLADQPPQPDEQPQPLEPQSLWRFLAKHFLKKPPRDLPQPSLWLSQQSLAQHEVLTGTSFSTHLRTIRQQVTVSQQGTHTLTVRVHW